VIGKLNFLVPDPEAALVAMIVEMMTTSTSSDSFLYVENVCMEASEYGKMNALLAV
jgi:hypothetical protein